MALPDEAVSTPTARKGYREEPTMTTTYYLTPNGYRVDTPSNDLVAAAFAASDWHGGLGCPLYTLQCGDWCQMTLADYEAALGELKECLTLCEPDDGDGYFALLSAIDAIDGVVRGWPGQPDLGL